MEFIFLLQLTFVIFILSLILHHLSCVLKPNKNATETLQLPPGDTGWPLVGETFKYLSMAKKGVTEKFITDRRNKYSSKLFKTSFLGETMVFLCTSEGNKFLFSNENKLVKSWWPRTIDKIFVNSNKTNSYEENLRMRKITLSLFKPDVLQKYVGIMDEVTKQHLKTYWDRKDVIQVYPLAKKFTLTLACRLLLNIDDPETIGDLEKPFLHVIAGALSLPINIPGTTLSRAIRASKEIQKKFEVMIKKMKSGLLEGRVFSNQDILSKLLLEKYKDGQLLSDSDVANKITALIVALNDNISVTVVSIMKYLAELPEVYDAVLREQMDIANIKGPEELLNWGDIKKMRYSWNVASEVLRLLPPAAGTFREALTTFNYGGFLIPKGWKLHWNAYATHKSPEYFPDPEKFDPSRFEGKGPAPFAYVPFGGGPRICPGKDYAKVKILVFMHNVVTKFKWEMVFPDEQIIHNPLLMPTKGLPIRLYPHSS